MGIAHRLIVWNPSLLHSPLVVQMQENEWDLETDPHQLLFCLGNDVSDRKLRLFCASCVRRIWPVLSQFNHARKAVETAEKFADNECSLRDLEEVALEADKAIDEATSYEERNALRAVAWTSGVKMDAIGVARSVVESSSLASSIGRELEREAQSELIKDIFGNPFRVQRLGVEIQNEITTIANSMYQQRDFGLMSKLAVEMKRKGCNDREVIAHCESDMTHVRGCWVVDMVLGKASKS